MHRHRFPLRLMAVGAISSALVLITVQSAWAAPGDPDGGFGVDGLAIFDNGAAENAERIVQGPGGKLYVGGEVDAFFFSLRIKPGGDEDDAYGAAGWAGKIVGDSGVAYGLAVAGDGSAFVAGSRTVGGATRGAVVKFDPSGNPDASFSGDGLAVVSNGSSDVNLLDVLVQPDGKVVVSGNVDVPGTQSLALLARLRPNGTLDPSFGQGGRVRTAFGNGDDSFTRVVRQPDGKLLAGGYTGESPTAPWTDPAFARYMPDGTLDSTFGNNGRSVPTVYEGGYDGVNGLVLAPGGKPLACLNGFTGGENHITVMRLTPKGKPDPMFGGGDGNAIVTVLGDTGCTDVAVQVDGKPLVAAYAGAGAEFSAVRFLAGGKLDKGFGSGGVAAAPFGTTAVGQKSVLVQSNGRIVVAGWVDFGNRDAAVARFLP